MIGKEDIARGLRFRTCWEGGVADITITDEPSGDVLPVQVPLEPFEFVVTDVYPRMGEVVVCAAARFGTEARGGAGGVHGVCCAPGCLPVRLPVERFLRIFGGYEIVERGGSASPGVSGGGVREDGGHVADGPSAVGDAVSFSVDEFREEADKCERLARMSSADEYARILGDTSVSGPYDYGACVLCELHGCCIGGMCRGLRTRLLRLWRRLCGSKPGGDKNTGKKADANKGK